MFVCERKGCQFAVNDVMLLMLLHAVKQATPTFGHMEMELIKDESFKGLKLTYTHTNMSSHGRQKIYVKKMTIHVPRSQPVEDI